MEKSIHYSGYALYALITFAPIAFASVTGVTVSMTALTGAVVNIGLNIAQGELLSNVKYPKVFRGSTVKLTMSYKKIWGPYESQQKLV
ncbi:exported hypothetical protein [Vibrio nigripulchritudo SFn118]|nr:exported hypothetical protein [Vibrio nigripulchritudo SFn118]